MWFSTRSLLEACCEAASCPWPPRITSTSQPLKRCGIGQLCGIIFICLLDLKRFGELGMTKEEFALIAFWLKNKKNLNPNNTCYNCRESCIMPNIETRGSAYCNESLPLYRFYLVHGAVGMFCVTIISLKIKNVLNDNVMIKFNSLLPESPPFSLSASCQSLTLFPISIFRYVINFFCRRHNWFITKRSFFLSYSQKVLHPQFPSSVSSV